MTSQRFLDKLVYVFRRIISSFVDLPLTTKSMIILVSIFYFLHKLADLSSLALFPLTSNFNPFQIFTYTFIEFGFLNTLFGVIALWLFATPIENYWSRTRFITFISLAIFSIAAFHLILSKWLGINGWAIFGTTGVIYSLLMAYGMMWPEKRVQLLLPPIPVKGKYLALVFAILLALGLLQTPFGKWALLTYFFGAFCCFLLIQFWRQKPPFKNTIKPKKNHLKRIK